MSQTKRKKKKDALISVEPDTVDIVEEKITREAEIKEPNINWKEVIKTLEGGIDRMVNTVVMKRNLYGKIHNYKWTHGEYDNLHVCLMDAVSEEYGYDNAIIVTNGLPDATEGYRKYVIDNIFDKVHVVENFGYAIRSIKNKATDGYGKTMVISFGTTFPSAKELSEILESSEGAMVILEGLNPGVDISNGKKYVFGPWRNFASKAHKTTGVDAYNLYMKTLKKCTCDIDMISVGKLAATLDGECLAICGENIGIGINPYLYLTKAGTLV